MKKLGYTRAAVSSRSPRGRTTLRVGTGIGPANNGAQCHDIVSESRGRFGGQGGDGGQWKVQGPVEGLLSLILGLTLTVGLLGCKGGGEAAGSVNAAPTPAPGVPVTLTVKSGRDFSCFLFGDSLYCKGFSMNLDIALATSSYILYARDLDSDLTALLVWDDTICWSSVVQTQPRNRQYGHATYCAGESTLSGNSIDPRIVYSGPSFTDAANGSADLTYARHPFMGCDCTAAQWLAISAVTDGAGLTSETAIDCEITDEGVTLACPGFSLNLN